MPRVLSETPRPSPQHHPIPRFGAGRPPVVRREPVFARSAATLSSRRPAGRRSRWVAIWWAASLLLHAVLLAVLLIEAGRERSLNDLAPAPSFEVVFEGGRPERAEAEPPPGLEVPPAPPVSATSETAASPPTPSVPVPPTPAVPVPPRPPDKPVAARQAAPQPLPAQPIPAQPTQPQPTQPRPTPAQATPRQAPVQAFPPGAVFLPGGVQLGRPAPPAAPAGRRQAQGLDLTVDPRLAEGAASADPLVRVTGAQVGADWRAAFRRWLDQNIRYPQRAIALQESGSVKVRVLVAADGTVRDVRLIGPSGSPSLNYGTTFPFSGAQLPAFPPPVDPNGVTIELTVNYILRQR